MLVNGENSYFQLNFEVFCKDIHCTLVFRPNIEECGERSLPRPYVTPIHGVSTQLLHEKLLKFVWTDFRSKMFLFYLSYI